VLLTRCESEGKRFDSTYNVLWHCADSTAPSVVKSQRASRRHNLRLRQRAGVVDEALVSGEDAVLAWGELLVVVSP